MCDKEINDLLKRIIYYPETGDFVWSIPLKNSPQKPGNKAGYYNHLNYLIIVFRRKAYCAHRLAWLHMTGKWPDGEIDHINGDPSDNRWCNLRDSTSNSNKWNYKKPKTNKSGEKGVSWDSKMKKWRAQVRKNYKYYVSYHKYWWQAARAVRRRREWLHGKYHRHN